MIPDLAKLLKNLGIAPKPGKGGKDIARSLINHRTKQHYEVRCDSRCIPSNLTIGILLNKSQMTETAATQFFHNARRRSHRIYYFIRQSIAKRTEIGSDFQELDLEAALNKVHRFEDHKTINR